MPVKTPNARLLRASSFTSRHMHTPGALALCELLPSLLQMLCMLVSRAGCDPHRLDFGAVGRLQESFLREAQAMYSNMKRWEGSSGGELMVWRGEAHACRTAWRGRQASRRQ